MKTRIISAIVAIALILPLVIIGGYPYIIGVSILSILAFKEMMDLKKSHKEIPSLMMLFSLVSLLILVLANNGFSISYGFTYQRILLIFLALILPVIFYKNDEYTTKDAFYLLGVTLFLGIVFNLFIVLRNRGLGQLIYVLCIPMITDIFALLGGMFFGKNKMCPKISPKKTWEGAFVGLLMGTMIGTILYVCLIGPFSLKIILVSALLSAVGQMGDLVMSKIKRENDIKDFSNIMPGHGGILDRIDSIIFVMITYITILFII